MNHAEPFHESDVVLTLPADGAFVQVLRTTAAALAARVNFTLDDIEDLRIAVSEAMALVLDATGGAPCATPDATPDPAAALGVGFALAPGLMRITLRAAAHASTRVTEDGFGWQVLTALTQDAVVTVEDATLVVRFTLRSSIPAR